MMLLISFAERAISPIAFMACSITCPDPSAPRVAITTE
jgi:hypothetical protein